MRFGPNAWLLHPLAFPTPLFCLASLIQSHPWTVNPHRVRRCRDLCAFAFELDGEIGIMPSVEYDGDEDATFHEYNPFAYGPAH